MPRLVVAALLLLLAASAGADGLDVSARAIRVRAPSGLSLELRPRALLLRDGAGAQRVIGPLPEPIALERGAGTVRVATHPGVVETWTLVPRLAQRVDVDASLLAGLGASARAVLTWDASRAGFASHPVVADVPLAAWLDAGAPVAWRIFDPALRALLPEGPRRPSASADCPGNRVVECGGSAAAEEQAWLDAFTGTADPGCDPVTRSLEIQDGVLQPILVFGDFRDIAPWQLNGRAATMGNPVIDDAGRSVLRLTSSFSESGSAFVSTPVALLADSSFRAFFTFRISLPGGSGDPDGPGADGLAFVLQSVANTAGGVGGGIGYQGIGQSVAVELDTWDNGAWDDYDGNHVGIDIEGSVDSVVQAHVARRMNDGDVWSAWVDYDGRTDRMEVRLDSAGVRPALPAVAWTVDVPAVLRGTDAFVGFTSGTGAAMGLHDILSFVFEAYAPVTCPYRSVRSVTATFVDACGNGAQCDGLFWTQDTSAPKLVPAAPLAGCGEALHATGDASGSALVAPFVDVTDACGSATVRNDRTAGGRDATDVYPCGVTPVRFDAVDDCGNASSCVVLVSVQPAQRPPDIGPALRVRKVAGEPELDWSLTTGPPGLGAAILACDGRPMPSPFARAPGRTWTDAGVTAPIRWYDVRAVDCGDGLSAD